MHGMPNAQRQESIDPIARAEQRIEVLRQEILHMGAIDFEPSAIDDVLSRLRAGKCTPAEAIAEVAAIRDHKQDYH